MDEAYDSPDSDGHGSIPSDDDDTYELPSELPGIGSFRGRKDRFTAHTGSQASEVDFSDQDDLMFEDDPDRQSRSASIRSSASDHQHGVLAPVNSNTYSGASLHVSPIIIPPGDENRDPQRMNLDRQTSSRLSEGMDVGPLAGKPLQVRRVTAEGELETGTDRSACSSPNLQLEDVERYNQQDLMRSKSASPHAVVRTPKLALRKRKRPESTTPKEPPPLKLMYHIRNQAERVASHCVNGNGDDTSTKEASSRCSSFQETVSPGSEEKSPSQIETDRDKSSIRPLENARRPAEVRIATPKTEGTFDFSHLDHSPEEQLNVAFPDDLPDDRQNMNQSARTNHSDTLPIASSTPKRPVTPDGAYPGNPGFTLDTLRKSRIARRVSMNTPPPSVSSSEGNSENLIRNMSLLSVLGGSEYHFPKNPVAALRKRREREFTPLFPVERHESCSLSGLDSTQSSPGLGSSIEHSQKHRCRARSQSDPLDREVDKPRSDSDCQSEKRLFSPSRVVKASEIEKPHANPIPVPEKAQSPGQSVASVASGCNQGSKDHCGPLTSSEISHDKDQIHDVHGLDSRLPSYGSATSASSRPIPSERALSTSLTDYELRIQTPASIHRVAESNSSNEPLSQPSTRLMSASGTASESASSASVLKYPVSSLLAQVSHLGSTIAQYRHFEGIRKGSESASDTNIDQQLLMGRSKQEASGVPLDMYQKMVQLEAAITALHRQISTFESDRQDEIQNKDLEIGHLRAALENRSEHSIKCLKIERQLEAEQDRYDTDMEKKDQMLEHLRLEKDKEIARLNGEVDELTNLMPVDPTHILDEDGHYLEGPSVTPIDHSLNDIIVGLSGFNSDDQEIDGSELQMAEHSLLQLATNAGFKDLDRAGLARFGIRTLRHENADLKRMVQESEDRLKHMAHVKDKLSREFEKSVSVSEALNNENGRLRAISNENERSAKHAFGELEEIQKLLSESAERTNELEQEIDGLRELEVQVEQLQSETDSLSKSCFELRDGTEQLKGQLSKSQINALQFEQEAGCAVEEAQVLRTQLDTAKREIVGLETSIHKLQNEKPNQEAEISSLQQQISTLERQLRQSKTLVEEKEAGYVSAQNNADRLKEELGAANVKVDHLKADIALNFKQADEIKRCLTSTVKEHEDKAKEWHKIKADLLRKVRQGVDRQSPLLSQYKNAIERLVRELKNAPEALLSQEEQQALMQGLQDDDVADLQTLARIISQIRGLGGSADEAKDSVKELSEKNNRLKLAIKAWMDKNEREKERGKTLATQNKELALRLKAEKKQSDEKIAQLILALRR